MLSNAKLLSFLRDRVEQPEPCVNGQHCYTLSFDELIAERYAYLEFYFDDSGYLQDIVFIRGMR